MKKFFLFFMIFVFVAFLCFFFFFLFTGKPIKSIFNIASGIKPTEKTIQTDENERDTFLDKTLVLESVSLYYENTVTDINNFKNPDTYDVNNFQNGPNEFGRDVFVIHVSSDIKKNKHYLAPAGSDTLFEEMPNLNNPEYGITGCSKDIGSQTGNTVYGIAGSGCSAKYLLE